MMTFLVRNEGSPDFLTTAPAFLETQCYFPHATRLLQVRDSLMTISTAARARWTRTRNLPKHCVRRVPGWLCQEMPSYAAHQP
jgi:hypothetical protein